MRAGASFEKISSFDENLPENWKMRMDHQEEVQQMCVKNMSCDHFGGHSIGRQTSWIFSSADYSIVKDSLLGNSIVE